MIIQFQVNDYGNRSRLIQSCLPVRLERLAGGFVQQFFLFLEIFNQHVQLRIRNHFLFPQVLDTVNFKERGGWVGQE